MRSARFLYSNTPSPCSGRRAILVRSREGGFVSQNCLKCGSPQYVKEAELPELRCDSCSNALAIARVDGTNYFYVCETCKRTWKLADDSRHGPSSFSIRASLPMAMCPLTCGRDTRSRMTAACPRD